MSCGNKKATIHSSPNDHLSPEEKCLLPSRLSFSWFSSYVWKSRGAGPVFKTDLIPLSEDLQSEKLFKLFQTQWKRQNSADQVDDKPLSLLWCLWSVFGNLFIISILLHVIAGASLQLTPWALKYFLQIMERRERAMWSSAEEYLGYLGCMMIFGLLLVKTVAGNQGYFVSYRTGIKIRSCLSSAVYLHLFKLSNRSKQVY